MLEDVTKEAPTEVSEVRTEKLDADVEEMTGEGLSISAFIQEQKAKRQETEGAGEKATAEEGKSQTPGKEVTTDEKATQEKSQESEQTAEEKATAEEGTSQESATPELSLDKVKEILGESGLSDLQAWKHSHETRDKWNSTLSLRAESLPFLEKITPEQWDILAPRLLPYIHGKETIPETPEKFIDETVENLNGVIPEQITVKVHDEDMDEDREMTVAKEHYLPVVKQAAGEIIKKALPELPVLREQVNVMKEQNEQMKTEIDEMTRINGYLVLDSFFKANPGQTPQAVDEKETPVDALFRIGESGEDHPEYGKYLKFESAAKLSKDRNVTFENAWDTLYGANERKIQRTEEVKESILESQKNEAGEKGGDTPPPDPLEKQKKRLPQTYADMVEEMIE